ncbi:hypothetical protein Tco_1114499 [Tanacetum coccineum]|uniref:Uncharacterized protein n=1 Tax=Tanacetum coccineum TaxID=301880 RepID=A0ABQ5IWA6_9ASTR
MHQPWRTFAVVINSLLGTFKYVSKQKARKIKKPASPSKKQNLVLEDEPTKKPKQAKHTELGKKSAPTKEDVSSKKPLRKKSVGVVIRDTPGVSVSKKKATAKVDRARAWIYFLM